MISGLAPREDDALAYREWLKGLVGELAPSDHTQLFEIAMDMEYEPTVPNDANRAQDGIGLRERYVRETSSSLPPIGPCTILEFLVALAHRLNEADYDYRMPNRVGLWFWSLMQNLGILEAGPDDVIEAFYKINHRTYDFDGFGGLFPLQSPREDQREVEIWYQMQAYLLEHRY